MNLVLMIEQKQQKLNSKLNYMTGATLADSLINFSFIHLGFFLFYIISYNKQ